MRTYCPGDHVVYGIHGVCRVLENEQKTVDRKTVIYYVLEPLSQPGARFYIPVHNPAAVSKIRPILTKEELLSILNSDCMHESAWIENENARKQHYRELICSGDRAGLIRMVHTLHRHKQAMADSGRKFHQSDENFMRDTHKLLTGEFAMILGISEQEVPEYVNDFFT